MTKKHSLIGNEKSGEEALEQMRKRGGTWAAYQNHEIGHSQLGHLKFLKVGEGCTYKEPPERMPDTQDSIGWRYLFVGFVNLEKGVIE